MAKVLSGILTAGDGTALANQSIKIVAINSTPPGVIKGAESVFITDGVGAYSVSMENGSYRVTAESASGGDIALGNILVQGLDPSDLPTLLALNEEPGRPVDDALQALADAAATSAQEAADSAATVNPSNFIAVTEKGVANGVAELGAGGKVLVSQSPESKAVFTAHGKIDHPSAQDDFDCPATVANEFTVKAASYRINDSVFSLADTTLTLPAASDGTKTYDSATDTVTTHADSAAAFAAETATNKVITSRKDLVYLKEDQTFAVFEGANDNPTMVDAGFSAVAGEPGLWFDGVDYAVPVAGIQRYNQGARHPIFNEWGCAKILRADKGASHFWYESSAVTMLSTEDTFGEFRSVGGGGGYIGAASGREDGRFYDAIYADRITDARLQAQAPSATQLAPNYVRNKVIAGEWKNYVTKGIPKLIPKEFGLNTEDTTETTTLLPHTLGGGVYSVGDFLVYLTTKGKYVASGYVSDVGGLNLSLASTPSNAIDDVRLSWSVVAGDIYTILKVEYTEATGADNTRTDIIGDPANYPRQATGVIDFSSDQGVQTIVTGVAIECVLGANAGGVPGNVYLYIAGGWTGDLSLINFAGAAYIDLGPKATFLANATGIEGFPLLYGENGEDLIPDGLAKTFKMSRKGITAYGRVVSTDKGVSWSANTGWDHFVSAGNSVFDSPSSDSVIMQSYKTPANIWTEAVNSAVLAGQLSDVWAGDYHFYTTGSIFVSDMTGKIPVSTNVPSQTHKNVEDYVFDYPAGDLNSNSVHSPTHSTINLGGTGPAAKAVFYKSAAAGEQIKLHALFKEMIYDSALDTSAEFTYVDGTVSNAFVAGEYYSIDLFAGRFPVRCVLSGSYQFSVYDHIGGEWVSNSGVVIAKDWDGNGWGDDNEFNVVDNVSTAVDDNGNTVLIGTKETVTPFVLGNK